MVSRTAWLLTVALAFVACAGGGPPAPSASAPRIAFDETRFDGGAVDAGSRVVHSYRFTNVGGLNLVIDNVRPSCNCSAAVPGSRVVAPQGHGTVAVEFDTTDVVGPQEKTISVYSNDPAQPVTMLTLAAAVRADVAADPPHLYVGHLRRGQTAPTTSRIVGRASVASVEAAGTHIDAALGGGTDARARQIAVTVKNDAPLGSFEEVVTVRTGNAHRPVLQIPVGGVVDGDVIATPAQLDFGVTTPDAMTARVIGIQQRGGQSVHILATRLTPALGTAAVSVGRDGRGIRVTVTLSTGLRPGKFAGTLEVETDHPEQRRIVVPFSGQVVEKS
jgi:hypothetical protein